MENEKFQELVMEHLIKLSQSDAEIKEQLGTVSNRLESLEANVLRIENDHGEKLAALIDAHKAQLEFNERFENSLHRIEEKFDRLELKVSTHDAVLRKAGML